MRIKKVRAKSVREALELVKAELGSDAVLLHTRKVSGGGLAGLRREEYEVTAGLDESAGSRPSPAAVLEASPVAVAIAPDPELHFDHFSPPSLADGGFGALRDDLRRMRSALTSLSTRYSKEEAPSEAGALTEIRKLLKQSEMDDIHMEALLSDLKARLSTPHPGGQTGPKQALMDLIAKQMPCEALGARRGQKALRVALVGPTGAGKTTTIAKLASHFRLRERLKVALVAADNYRIAAVEQLQSFAEIAELPMEVVFNEAEMASALSKFDAYDLVFIDTAGRSQRNTGHMNDLRKLLSAARPDEVHLTLSMATKPTDLKDIARAYGEIGFQRLLFTKLDETLSFGPMYSLAAEFKKPVSYVSVGQQVPDDICLADPKELAFLITGGRTHD